MNKTSRTPHAVVTETGTESAVVAAFRDALVRGERAFLWGVPGGGALAALGEGDAPWRVGASGFRGEGPMWRPARVVFHGAAFGPGVEVATAASPAGAPTTQRSLPGGLAGGASSECAPSGPTRHWIDAVGRATSAMRAGALRKVVLARQSVRRASAGEGFDATATWQALRAANPGAFTFAVAEAGRVFLGASPERLVSLVDGTLQTEALAGTLSRAGAPETLLASAKDREEHALVVAEIVSGLGPFVEPGTLCWDPNPGLKALPRIWHLHTPITARLRSGATLLDVVRALHPTPAVCGVPRAAAARFLRENEGFERDLYAGPVGWVSDAGEGTFAVGLRSALLTGDTATLYAGAGLVAASEATAEWHETALKLRTVEETLRTRGVSRPC